ncbi:MAG: hypothetical protein JRE40_14725 [Deltaproteobacteria bacterium]|nr:hypothetical protein [Deltaproteobacteria bacterium]MBW2672679.1 hypothetical protein [Deltaproteobacteria bacterium]
MGKRIGRRRTLRIKKQQAPIVTASVPEQEVAVAWVVMVGRKQPGQAPRIRVDFTAFSEFGAEVVEEMASRMGWDGGSELIEEKA